MPDRHTGRGRPPGQALPVNWKPGDKVVVPAPKSEKDVEDRLAGNYERLDFYLCTKELVG